MVTGFLFHRDPEVGCAGLQMRYLNVQQQQHCSDNGPRDLVTISLFIQIAINKTHPRCP